MPKDVGTYLAEQQKKSSGDVATEWGQLEELYNKKLWHQLTLRLGAFVKNPVFSKGDGLIRMYENFIADFEHRINALALAEIVVHVVRQITDPKQAIDFLEKIKEKVKSNDEAKILCMTTIGTIKLRGRDIEGTKQVVEECRSLLEAQDGVTTVHSRFYELSSNYHKLMGNHAEYYKDALRFLGCTQLDQIPANEHVERAFNLGLAAVLGEGIYNFGELLAHPILESLKGTDKEWLVNLMYAFNSGNISKFDDLKKSWGTQPDLAASEIPMRQKISLLCLMEMTFKRPATNRQLTFQEIAAETRLPENEVEMLVMKALSLGLVKGSIDEVDNRVHLTWVQPRVLDLEQELKNEFESATVNKRSVFEALKFYYMGRGPLMQSGHGLHCFCMIGTMQNRLQQWCEDVRQMERLLEVKAHDILT